MIGKREYLPPAFQRLALICLAALLCSSCPEPFGPFINPVDPGYVPVNAVSLARGEIYLRPGEEYSLAHELSPRNASDTRVRWTSDDEAVATVSDGVIRAKGHGTATITAEAYQEDASVSCIVRVPETFVELSGLEVTWDSGMNILASGASARLLPRFFPPDATDQNLDWSSRDEGIARVDAEGRVSALSAGDVIIDVYPSDYRLRHLGQWFSLSVKSPEESQLSGFQLSYGGSLRLGRGEQFSVTALKDPPWALDRIIWTSSNPLVALVSDTGLISSSGVGSCAIEARAGAYLRYLSIVVDDYPFFRTGSGVNNVTGRLVMTGDGNRVFLKNGGWLYVSTDRGKHWVERGIPRPGIQYNFEGQIAASVSGDMLLISARTDGDSRNRLYLSRDEGLSWIPRDTAGSQDWGSLAISPNGDLLAASAGDGVVKTSRDEGTTWESVRPYQGTGLVIGLAALSGGRVFAVCASDSNPANGGFAYQSSDYGHTWNRITMTGEARLTELVRESGGDKLFLASSISGEVWKLQDGEFSKIVENLPGALKAVSANGSVLVSGAASSVSVSTDSGASWRDYSGRWLLSASASADGSLLLASDYGQAYLWDRLERPGL